jgi:hypothetical protein
LRRFSARKTAIAVVIDAAAKRVTAAIFVTVSAILPVLSTKTIPILWIGAGVSARGNDIGVETFER